MENKYTQQLDRLKSIYADYEPAKADWNSIQSELEEVSVGKPMILKVLIILGGQLSSLAFIGFLAAAGAFNDGGVQVVLGFLFLVLGLGIPYIERNNYFLDSLAFSFSLVGLCLGVIFLDETLLFKEEEIAGTGVIILPFLFLISRIQVQQFAAALAFIFAIAVIQWENKWYEGIHLLVAATAGMMTLIMLSEASWLRLFKQKVAHINSLLAACTLGLGILLLVSVNKEFFAEENIRYWWISSLVLVILLTASLITIVRRMNLTFPVAGLLVAGLILGASCIFAPGILAALLLIVLAQYTARYFYLVAGVIALISFVISFYYNLHISLLSKSLILMGTGAAFLLAYWVFFKWFNRYEKK